MGWIAAGTADVIDKCRSIGGLTGKHTIYMIDIFMGGLAQVNQIL